MEPQFLCVNSTASKYASASSAARLTGWPGLLKTGMQSFLHCGNKFNVKVPGSHTTWNALPAAPTRTRHTRSGSGFNDSDLKSTVTVTSP
eukprot:1924879-Rhodomonas_salina.1